MSPGRRASGSIRSPSPPADFRDREPSITEIGAGQVLSRIHRTGLDPLHFGRAREPEDKQRWYAPDESYGICYLAVDAHIAFAETLARKYGFRSVEQAEIEARSLTQIEVLAPLRLASMHGPGLRIHGADASVVQGPYELTWAWSGAIHDHKARLDGICFRARHDDSGFSIALFERAAARVRSGSSMKLGDGLLTESLAGWLDRYGLGITS